MLGDDHEFLHQPPARVNEGLLLLLAAAAFAFVSGVNDGSSLVAINLPNVGVAPLPALLVLAVGVVVVPFVVGAQVAETIAHGLVAFTAEGGTGHFLGAVLVALAITFALSRWGLPTSLTLALLGAIVGTGLGVGLPVAWATVGVVVVVALLALAVSALLGLFAARVLAYLPLRRDAWSQLRLLGIGAYGLQSIAYAANDGQKMLAVLAIALGLDVGGRIAVEPGPQLLLGVLFALGTLAGIERFAGRLGRGILPARAVHAGASQLASGGAVLAAAAAGVPVSLTQAATAALVGAGVSETVFRVRWQHAARIGAAWLITLPASALGGALVGFGWRLAS